jgi:hypothetical protein
MNTHKAIKLLEWIRDSELNYTLEKEMEALTHAIEHMKRGQWQPIETAPKDGELFLICLPRMMNLIIRARFDRIHKLWLSERGTDGGVASVEFFHQGDLWMPLPEPPQERKD